MRASDDEHMARLARYASAPPASVGDHSYRAAEPAPARSKRRLRSVLHSVGVLEDAELELKRRLRRGIGRADRAGVWTELIARFGPYDDRLQHAARYHAALNDAFGGELGEGASGLPPPPDLRWVPAFGGAPPCAEFARAHGLSEAKLAVVRRVLCALASASCREACPPLPDVVGLLSHELPEPLVHSAALALLSSGQLLEWDPDGKGLPKPRSGVLAPPRPTPRAAFERSVLAAFAQLAAARCGRCVGHLASLGLCAQQLCGPWLTRFFVGALPYATAVRVFDSFLLEGAKVLFRVGIALLQRHTGALLACTSAEQARATLAGALGRENDGCCLMGAAFGLRAFRLAAIHNLQRKALREGTASARPALAQAAPAGHPPRAQPRHAPVACAPAPRLLLCGPSSLLGGLGLEARRQLWAALPHAERGRDGVLVYCSLAHGSSLRTLYARCEAAGADVRGALVVARPLHGGGLLGGYASRGVRPSAGQAYGSGESFLFAAPEPAGCGVRVHGWSRASSLFAHGDTCYWAMGGGSKGGFGLSVDGEVCTGTSAPCETFGLDASLHAGGAGRFTYGALEVWALQ